MEVGRVAVITYGPDNGKPVVIVDIIDQARALIDGPTSGVARQPLTFRRLQLTPYKLPITRSVSTKNLLKVIEKEKFSEEWKKSPWAKKQAIRKARADMSDFDRYKLKVAKQTRRKIVSGETGKAKA